MLQIAICDDESRIREYLKKLVQQNVICDVTVYSSGQELLAANRNFDILLLDISMDGLNGMEVAKKIREYSRTVIIFITARKDYVFEAFDVGAFHYLLKPVKEDRLVRVLQKAIAQTVTEQAGEPLVIKTGNTYRRVNPGDIIYAENSARKIILHTRDGQIEFYGKMEELAEQLGETFYRSHRGYLVNLKEVVSYDATSITLKNGETVFMAKQKYGAFITAYMKYLRRE